MVLLAALIDNMERRGADVVGPLDQYMVEALSRPGIDPEYREGIKAARELLGGLKDCYREG